MLPGILSAALLLSMFPQINAGTPQGRLRGHLVDASGGAIPATIRVIRSDTNAIVLRFRAQENGTFETSPLTPGVYSLTAFAQGFRRRELHKIVIEPDHVFDLGQISLDLSGCDTPGTNCDYFFGDTPDEVKRIVAASHATLKLPCAVDLDRKGEAICSDVTGSVLRPRDADLRLAKENETLYLIAMNGAALCKPDAATPECSGVTFGIERIGVVGLGPGVDFCVRTKRGSVSHVFFTNDIENESTTVALWYVTRKPR